MNLKNILACLSLMTMVACGGQESTSAESAVKESPAMSKKKMEKADPSELSNGTPVVNYDGLKDVIFKDDGTTYVINFWATWCKPCVEELPYFEQLTESYDDDKVKVILVSQDFKRQWEKKLVPFMQDRALKSDVIVLNEPDGNTWISDVNEEWSGALPATIIHRGNKSEFHEGSYASFEELNEKVKAYF